MMRHRIPLPVWLLVLSATVIAPVPSASVFAGAETAPSHVELSSGAPTVRTAYPAVEKALQELLAASPMEPAVVGFCFFPLDAEQPALDHNGRKGLVPASTFKALTTGVALEMLGPEFRFETRLQHDGTLDAASGVLDGHLYIKGGGDPTLAETGWDKLFTGWHKALADAGLTTSITGSIVGDATIYGSQRAADSWPWSDLGNYYAAGASGLTFHRNLYRIYFNPGQSKGSAAKFLRTNPPIPGAEFINEMRTGAPGSGDGGYVYSAPYTNRIFLRGTIPAGSSVFAIRGAVPDPALLCAQRFSAFLKEKGIRVQGAPKTLWQPPKDAPKTLHTHTSQPLRDIIIPMNHKSINVYAECVFRMLGVHHAGLGTSDNAAAAVRSFLATRSLKMTGLYIADGSGLSPRNSVTPRQMTYILKFFAEGEHSAHLMKSLPVAGKSGTLKSIGGGTAAAGRVRAKSGTLDQTKCYAGYVNAVSGKRFAFSLMVNRYAGHYAPVKRRIARLMAAMAQQ